MEGAHYRLQIVVYLARVLLEAEEEILLAHRFDVVVLLLAGQVFILVAALG